jgi:hypothetical protein
MNKSKLGKNNPSYKDGRTLKQYYCKCGKIICYNNFHHGSGMCGSCCKKDKKLTKVHKERIAKAQKKRFKDPKEREKMSRACIGRPNGMLGKTQSKATRDKISKSKIGKPHTQEHKDKISKALTIHGNGRLPYSPEFTPSLKKSILERDNHKCQNPKCNCTQEEHFKKYGRDIEVHHIDYNKFNCKESNLIILCHKCNIIANHDRDYYYVFYTYKIEEKRGLLI